MSNPTKILVEKFQLRRLLSERSFATWNDKSDTPRSLGVRSLRNKQNIKFIMDIYHDMEGHIHIYLSLTVFFMIKRTKHEVETLLVVPPDADFGASEPCTMSKFRDLADDTASAIHDAELSSSAEVICIKFDLRAKGFIVMKKKLTETVLSRNHTSTQLLLDLESLSHATTFTVYFKPNTYAKVGLNKLCDRLKESPTNTRITMKEMKEMYEAKVPNMYIPEVPELVESEPPPYTGNPTQLSPEVRVPQSPSIPNADVRSSPNFEEAIPPTPDPLPMYHGIFSPDYEQPLDVAEDLDLDDVYKDLGQAETYPEVDSDEEYFAALNAQQLSQQLRQDETSMTLSFQFREWLNAAIAHDGNMYQREDLTTKLFTLGTSVRKSDVELFKATKPWCSALFLFDPSDPSGQPSKQAEGYFVSDMAQLIK
ncbi:hypothetical protein ACMFMG_005410 [Clarireedia jacksonii]